VCFSSIDVVQIKNISQSSNCFISETKVEKKNQCCKWADKLF